MKAARSVSAIHDILEHRGVCAHFQPILSARQKSVVGFEALARGIAGSDRPSINVPSGQWIQPDKLFGMARREGVSAQLEQLCRQTAIRTFAELRGRPNGLVLFMNFEPSPLLSDEAAADQLYDMCQADGVSPRNVAIEILEFRIDDFARLSGLFDRLRALGFMIVLDDVGAGHSNLNRIPLIKPDILKVDRELIQNIDSDYYKQETLKSLVGLARRIGALVVAEGVETEKEAITSLELGVDFLQGFFLSKPQEIRVFSGGFVADAIVRTEALAARFKGHMVGKINERKLQHRRFNVILNQLVCDLTSVDANEFDKLLSEMILRYKAVECIYILDEDGNQITDTICNANIPRPECGVMFNPAPKGTDHSLKEYYYILMDVELQKFATDPYVSLASGNLCRTVSTVFRDAANNKMYVLCMDVTAADAD
jgi:EAL domain-containing protein (putative c-di-GMP-specific phosphodiesterase class I)